MKGFGYGALSRSSGIRGSLPELLDIRTYTFLNLTDAPGELIVVYTPGGRHKFYEELGPATRNGTPDRAVAAAIFEKHDMSLLGPPLSAD